MFALSIPAAATAYAQPAEQTVAELRTTTNLARGWRFTLDNSLGDEEALRSTPGDWAEVRLPHTWNAEDAASLDATTPYRRGVGWYRLEFDTPTEGARHWLEFGAASLVADVWLNGERLGRHDGAFTAFRFDVTDALSEDGANVLLVKADNRAPEDEQDRTAIMPLAGDFNVSGGLYRHVALISTTHPVHIALDDLGGPGVYAATAAVADGSAMVLVRTKVSSNFGRGAEFIVRATMLDDAGRVAGVSQRPVFLAPGDRAEVAQDLVVEDAHLWHGVKDPYLYTLVVDVLGEDEEPIDRVVQGFGIRQIRFDPDLGFFLNGERIRLRGVAMHQDYLGKAWAISEEDMDESLMLIKEIGANTVRFGHYPFGQHALRRADEMGFIVWAEIPFQLGVTVQPLDLAEQQLNCPDEDATEAYRANGRRQLREMIRQQYNHPSVAVWSIGNETTFFSEDCPMPPYDNITPVLRELNAVAKEEDPTRSTTLADFSEEVIPAPQGGYIAVGGISDVWAINQYHLWYGGPVAKLGELLDALHARYPHQPIGMSEYGAGAALTHHTDDPRGGPAESNNPGVPVVYQPEEYAAYVHEQNYAMLESRDYVWGTYVWNMFDFGSGIRNEGDLRGVNTKGLVTFDRQIKKDPFYFYKANWSDEPVTYIVGRRYTDRAYPYADVKVYSNADEIGLWVNGEMIGAMPREAGLMNTFVFEKVPLDRGENVVVAEGLHGGESVRDRVRWSRGSDDVNIAAGQLATGFTSAEGGRYGSDFFFIGGRGVWLIEKGTSGVTDPTPASGTRSPDLFKNYRRGDFSYLVPLEDGEYEVTLGFLEPDRITAPGNRVFDVVANGEPKIRNLDVLREAGSYRTAITKRFTTDVRGGTLLLEFRPRRGEAVVSNISIKRR